MPTAGIQWCLDCILPTRRGSGQGWRASVHWGGNHTTGLLDSTDKWRQCILQPWERCCCGLHDNIGILWYDCAQSNSFEHHTQMMPLFACYMLLFNIYSTWSCSSNNKLSCAPLAGKWLCQHHISYGGGWAVLGPHSEKSLHRLWIGKWQGLHNCSGCN